MTDEMDMIDLNLADVEALSMLPGIGRVLAERIVDYRETVHPFEEVIELAAVTGISERMVRNIEGLVTVATPATFAMAPDEGATGALADESAESSEKVDESDEGQLEPEEHIVPEAVAERELETTPLGDLPSDEVTELEEEEQAAIPEVTEVAGIESTVETSPELDTVATEEAEEPEPVEVRGLEDAAPAPPPAPSTDGEARRRGCIVLVLGAILGALIGTALTLAILAAINRNTLLYADADARLRTELDSASQARSALADQYTSMESQLDNLTSRTEALLQEQADMSQSLSETQRSIDVLERNIASLEETAGELDERIIRIAAAAEAFNTFLDGLRDLLFDLQGPPPTSTPTPTPVLTTDTPTPASTPATGTAETAEPPASPTSSGPPTRTPRPTATPFTLPTGTPEPQP